MSQEKIHHYIHLLGTGLLVIGLPVSHFLLSISIILLSINWATEIISVLIFKHNESSADKITFLKSRKAVWIILSIYLIHLIWFINTSDYAYGLHDIRIKLPLLALPLIYGTSPRFDKKWFKIILQLFLITVLISSFISTYVILGFSKLDLIDSRYASIFISHIRFSLIVVLLIFTLIFMAFFKELDVRPWEKMLYIICIVWFICFLILLQSFTGIVIFLILLPFTIIWWSYNVKRNRLKIISLISTSIIICFMIFYGVYSYTRYTKKNEDKTTILEKYTVNGNPYKHEFNYEEYENGYLIWSYVSESELRKEWNSISSYKYDSLDRKGQSLRNTLIRYLTSLGYKKDSVGISKLRPEDIVMIEKGYTNHLFKHEFALYPRIYVLLWEIEQYCRTGDPNGKSLGQRLEYLKTGIHILKRHFWFGTGTGDLNYEFHEQYKLDNSKLCPELRHRTHNQFITFFLTFGIFGFLWFLFALFVPPLLEKKYGHYLFTLFFLIGILSMLNEDTLETHVGVSFFAFFYSFFLFSTPEKTSPFNEST